MNNINGLASILFSYSSRLVALVAIVASSTPASAATCPVYHVEEVGGHRIVYVDGDCYGAAPCLVYRIEEVDGHRIVYVDGDCVHSLGSEEGNLPAGGGGWSAPASGGGVDLLYPPSLLLTPLQNVNSEKNKK